MYQDSVVIGCYDPLSGWCLIGSGGRSEECSAVFTRDYNYCRMREKGYTMWHVSTNLSPASMTCVCPFHACDSYNIIPLLTPKLPLASSAHLHGQH